MSYNLASKRKRPSNNVKRPAIPHKRSKRAAAYHSSSEDEVEPIKNKTVAKKLEAVDSSSDDDDGADVQDAGDVLLNLADDVDETSNVDEEVDSEDADSDDSDNLSQTSSQYARQRAKRNDPTAFATSISRILDSKLTTSKRADPVLSRSKAASTVAKELTESKLEQQARRKLREDKKAAQDTGRVRDVLATTSTDVSTAEVLEHEKRLRKMAQRGVVKLFNAVRAAQVRAEEATQDAKSTVGIERRAEKVNEMTKKGFLDLIVEGGAGGK